MKSELKDVINKAGKHIKSDCKAVIFGHVNPDGDALGSTLGLKYCLKHIVNKVDVVLPNNYPYFLDWMPGAKDIIIFDQETKKAKQIISEADLLFFCDLNDPKRVEDISEVINERDNIKIMIDHHPQPAGFVDYIISDTTVSSASELMYEFITELYGQNLNIETATCLLTGIITDTGLFDHNSENVRTFEIVAKLLENGADKKHIINKIYNENPYRRLRLMGNVLHNKMEYLPEYGTAYIYLTIEDMDKYNYQDGDSEGFVNIALSLADVNFAVLFTEKENYVKLSLRSTGNFDVNKIARKYYNGGGHTNAAGGKSYKSMEKTLDEFNNIIKQYKTQIVND